MADLDQSGDLNELTQPAPSTTDKKHVTIPYEEWVEFKKQNERMLEALNGSNERSISGRASKKRKRVVEHEYSDGELDENALLDLGQDENREAESNDYQSENEYFSDTENENLTNKLGKLCERVKNTNRGDNSQGKRLNMAAYGQEYKKEEETGPKIDSELADILKTMAQGDLEGEALETKLNKHKRPQNCDYFVPKVNTEVWSCMEHQARSDDLKSQRRQRVILTAANVIAKTAEKVVTGQNMSQDELFENLLDAGGLVLKALHDYSSDRRQKIVNGPNMDKKYKKLASAEVPITSNLFGDDLKAACVQIETSSKLGNSFTQSSRGRKFFPMRGAKNYQTTPQRGGWRGYPRGAPNQGSRYQRGRGRRPQRPRE